MIHPSLLTDELAERIALEAIRRKAQERFVDGFAEAVTVAIHDCTCGHCKDAEETAPGEWEPGEGQYNANPVWNSWLIKLFEAIEPFEKRYAAFLRTTWEEERKIIVANIRKLKKAYT